MTILRLEMPQMLYIFKVLGTFAHTWPPDLKSTKRELLFRDFLWVIALLNTVVTLIAIVLNTFHCSDDIVKLMKSLSEFTALSDAFLNLILCKIGRLKLQNLMTKIHGFLESVNEQENIVLRKYIDRYLGFTVFSMTAYMTTAIAFSCGPIVMSTSLPADAWYPFPIKTPLSISIIYISQIAAILQTGINITVDFTIGMFFWYAAARLEMLQLELGKIENANEISVCIRKHQEIIRFVEETQDTVVYIISKTNITMACAIIFGGIPLVYNQPFAVVAQFTCMVIGGCQKLYIIAWPADDLREVSEKVGVAAFSTKWMEKPGLSKMISFIIQRSQKPLVIRMGALFPALSLIYYSEFLKSISSYFMTMRAAIDK